MDYEVNKLIDNKNNSKEEKIFNDIFVNGFKPFIFNNKLYYIKLPNAYTEQRCMLFFPKRVKYYIEQGALTLSQLENECRNNPVEYPRIYIIVEEIEKIDEEGNKYYDYERRLATEEEQVYIMAAIKKGYSLNTIKKELGLKDEDDIEIQKSATENMLSNYTAESLAEEDMSLFRMMISVYNEDKKQVFKEQDFDNFIQDTSGFREEIFKNYLDMFSYLNKKK